MSKDGKVAGRGASAIGAGATAIAIAMAGGIHVALLRGINVGGKNRLPMDELAAMFSRAGCADVRTYINSGNVVFFALPELAESIPALIAGQIREEYGIEVPVVLRTRDELEIVARSNPFLSPGAGFDRLMVMFLSTRPDPEMISKLDHGRSPPDEFMVIGREIYLKCPNGFARTKLTNAYFDSKLKTTSTGRNWNSVLKLLEIAAGKE